MRTIKYIVLHCTATPQSATVESIQRYWKNVMKWNSPGYHYLIEANGNIHNLQPIEKPSNGVAGYNQHSIHISYIGGVDQSGKPIDNRTPAQEEAMKGLLVKLLFDFPQAEVLGHRDFPNVKKACPSFDVKKWFKKVNLNIPLA